MPIYSCYTTTTSSIVRPENQSRSSEEKEKSKQECTCISVLVTYYREYVLKCGARDRQGAPIDCLEFGQYKVQIQKCSSALC
jgi:hypothetical protein